MKVQVDVNLDSKAHLCLGFARPGHISLYTRTQLVYIGALILRQQNHGALHTLTPSQTAAAALLSKHLQRCTPPAQLQGYEEALLFPCADRQTHQHDTPALPSTLLLAAATTRGCFLRHESMSSLRHGLGRLRRSVRLTG
jgi:hypothetical protein